MQPIASAPSADQNPARTPAQSVPLAVITILFFMWGLLTSLNDVLIPHLKSVYSLNYVQAMLVQFCFFGAYFIVSLPAGALIRQIGYKRGVVVGLAVAALGCALFYPAATSGYAVFLFAFFVLAAGITVLQVAANPYVTALGAPVTASSRLTLTQAFNSLGTAIGPLLGGMLILGGTASAVDVTQLAGEALVQYRLQEAAAVRGPYLALAAALLVLAVLFALMKLPAIQHDASASDMPRSSILAQSRLVLGAVGIFLYVGGEVAIGSFLINFISEPHIANLSHADAAHYVSYYWGAAMVGRFIGFAVMRRVSPGKALAFNAVASIVLVLVAILCSGPLAMWSLVAVGLFNSIMFPTIFSMALHELGPQTGQGSGILCMAIVGGAIVPFLQGLFADAIGVQPSFLVPAGCYVFILYFGLRYAHMYKDDAAGG